MSPALASAAYLRFASPVTVGPNDTASGRPFAVPSALSASDMISLPAAGTTCLQSSGTACCTNAPGIVVVAGTTPVGGFSMNGATAFGALLLGNGTLGFHQVFAISAANGLGSGTPPTTLTILDTPGSIGFASGTGAGEVLEFRLSDTLTSDNAGGYRITEIPVQEGQVPEPASFALVAAGAAALVALRRRRA